MEPVRNRPQFDLRQKRRIIFKLNAAELFETFLPTHYVGQKRFSLEGGEMLIPLLDAIIERSATFGVREIVLGMPHRGRLNVLANTLNKPYGMIFGEFEENLPETVGGDGDVKYHLGFSADHVTADKHTIHLSLTPNPSHLEAVNPVVEGRVRAKQRRFKDRDRKLGMPILIHGDAAFAGQGLVAETLNLSQLHGYRTGGTIHIVVNNQIGFTTAPSESRSTRYCTDVAKMIEVPIFHVNGEDPEAVVYVGELALDFRETFGQDVVIDMVCYRRHGHNEGDEPAFTQPLMYGKIRDRMTIRELYTEQLVMAGELSTDEVETIAETFRDKMEEKYHEVHGGKDNPVPAQPGFGGHLDGPVARLLVRAGRDRGPLRDLARDRRGDRHRAPRVPVQPQDRADLRGPAQGGGEPRGRSTGRRPRRWPSARSCSRRPRSASAARTAAGGRSASGTPTWSTCRPARRTVPLKNLAPEQAELCIYDSLLSEAAVLGFDYGYSLDEPHMLIIWEAQFGDFANGAQVIIDQFIASGESKWGRGSGLVMLLPHGYEGQGPEHSSARLERFLSLCAEDNIQVVNADDPGAVLPPASPPGPAQLPQAADRDDPQEPAPAQAGRLAGRSLRLGPVPRGPRRPGRRRRGAPGPRLLGQGLLRPAGPARGGRQDPRGRDRPARAVLPLARRDAPGGARALSLGPRVGLGPGRVAEHGGLDVRRTPAPGADGDSRSSTSAATPAPARRPARTRSTTASKPSWSRRPSARPCPTSSRPTRSTRR